MGAKLHGLRVAVWGEAPETPEERKTKTLTVLRTYCCIAFFFNYLDRAVLGNAYVSGMKEDINLTGNQYNILVTCLSVGYIIGQVPHGLVIQKVAPRIWFPLMTVVWALLTMACAATKSFCLAIKLGASLPELPSVHVSLGALSWSCILKTRSSSVEEYARSGTAKLLAPVNWRPRAFADQTEGFYGNGALNVICEMPASTIRQAASDFYVLGQITTALDESFSHVDEEFVTKRLKLFKAADPKGTYINMDFNDEAQIAFNTWRYFVADTVWGLPGLDVTDSNGSSRKSRKERWSSLTGDSADGGMLRTECSSAS
ncbi:unnamed protein product [Clonostachys rosea f. rosea IK726]|uniref:Uncharacterized protein n=1 Tax=Clonostachys rosea f. rosea IK726 TaxID=1349383 RepID=A0ACA9U7Z2_BIOOC|nr:unnamed protein product [Clonostachys rosea f. rosea IK726]